MITCGNCSQEVEGSLLKHIQVSHPDWIPKRRGFAVMPKDRHLELSRKGGSRKGVKGFAAMSPELRVELGRKGGQVSRSKAEE